MSKETATLDQTKGKTLDEISSIVTDITQTLKMRKNKLAPQIKELRAVRQKYQALEGVYLTAKSKHEHTAIGLETERVRLEKECNQLQEECLREESRYHYLNSLADITDGQLARVREEAKFEAGEGRLLRNFKTWRELYANKVQQQEQLAKQLRKQQKDIKENEGPNMAQRAMYLDLQSLLQLKLKLYKDMGAQQQQADAANIAAFDTMEIGGAVSVCWGGGGVAFMAGWLVVIAGDLRVNSLALFLVFFCSSWDPLWRFRLQNVMTIDQDYDA